MLIVLCIYRYNFSYPNNFYVCLRMSVSVAPFPFHVYSLFDDLVSYFFRNGFIWT